MEHHIPHTVLPEMTAVLGFFGAFWPQFDDHFECEHRLTEVVVGQVDSEAALFRWTSLIPRRPSVVFLVARPVGLLSPSCSTTSSDKPLEGTVRPLTTSSPANSCTVRRMRDSDLSGSSRRRRHQTRMKSPSSVPAAAAWASWTAVRCPLYRKAPY
ncbi:MAG: hypothetical protein Udaeo2_21450 [Candidatus Udaeobacter sp.]|nr:MAG: hypothetical protein Udaeo2_21450 [Candidatus Udaeobacter sp.]